MNKLMSILLTLFLSVSCFAYSTEEILSTWQENYSDLDPMSISYTRNIIKATPLPGADPNIMELMSRYMRYMTIERVDKGDKFYTRISRSKEGFADSNSIKEVSFDGLNQTYYTPSTKGAVIYLGRRRDIPARNHFNFYTMSNSWTIDPMPEFEQFFRVTDPNDTITIRPSLEEVNGEMCHVLDKFNNGLKTRTLWVACEKGMLPMKYGMFSKGIEWMGMEVKEVGLVNGLYYPKRSTKQMTTYKIKKVYEVTVLEFSPKITVDDSVFHIKFSPGTSVTNDELGITYTVGVE